MKKLQRRRILLSLLPLAILLCFVYGYSLVTVLFSAFTGFTGSSAGKFVGMKNFQLIFKDIWPTVKITLIWTFGSVLPAMVAGLALAVFCNRNFKGKKAAVSINLIPYAIPLIIVASCWRFVYNPDFGVLNVLLSKLGLIEKPISFLGFDLALLSVIIARIWRAMPFAFMNYYSALTTIPKDLYEAAAIDGASPSQAFWNITMPHLRTTTSSTLLVLTVCNHLFIADPCVLLHCFPKSQLAFVTKQENQKLFVVGKVMHKILCQPIDRENDRAALKTIIKCIQLLKDDEASVAVFPEGYTSKDGKLHHFRSGVFKIAQKANVPIVVCTIQNTRQIFRNVTHLKPTDVELHLVDVIPAENLKGKTTVDIGNQVYEMMIGDLGESFRAEEA